MIPKVVWYLSIFLVIKGNDCSPTERDLYVFTTIVSEEQPTTEVTSIDEEVRDTEPAETNTYSDPYGGSTEFNTEESSGEPPGPPDHVIPYSEHENPEEVPTRPKYVAPGAWAKPDPDKNIPLDFVPTKMLAQVRGTHTVKVLPQSEAIAAATTDEERANAPRLREVVSKKKTNTIYTEEGYEDSAYDHAGHIRDADFHEGYARKLHDQRRSKARSGARGKKKSKKRLRNKPSGDEAKEFEEFSDDYSDQDPTKEKYSAEGSSKQSQQNNANKISKDMWRRPDINPKIVAENEIQKLEHDLKREDEEAEKGSENYGSVTERDFLRYNDEEDSKEKQSSENSEYSPGTREDSERNERYPSSETKENIYKENYEATTVQFEPVRQGSSGNFEASTSSYEIPTTNQYYIPEGSAVAGSYEATTFSNDDPNHPQSHVNEAPTTENYGQIFWKYFQTMPNEATSPSSYTLDQTTVPQPAFARDSTTLGPFVEQQPPVALATINGHGPYLLVSENGQVTQNPNQFATEGVTFYPGTPNNVPAQENVQIQNGRQFYNPNSVPNQEYRLGHDQITNSRSGHDFPTFINSNGPATLEYNPWGLNNAYGSQEVPVLSTVPSTTGFFDSVAFSSTPSYSFVSSTPKATSREDSSYRKNPFLPPGKEEVRNQETYDHKNFDPRYNGWGRGEPSGVDPNEGNPSSLKSRDKKGGSFFGYDSNLKYAKMLGFIKSQQNGGYDGQKSESADSEDFTIMKPPALRESVFSDFTLNSYPNVAGYSGATQESEAAKEADRQKLASGKNSTKYNGLSRKNIHFEPATFYGGNSQSGIGRKKLFPAAKLLPPPPNRQDIYNERNFANRNNPYFQVNSNFGNNVPNYNPDPEQLARYLASRRSPQLQRYTRSLSDMALNEEKIADAVIAQEINARFNFTFEDQGSTKYRDFGEPPVTKSRVKRNLLPEERQSVIEDSLPLPREISLNENHAKSHARRGHRSKRSHQDLLDASHKIAGDVIDEEIKSRFKNSDEESAGDHYEEGEEDEAEDEDEDEEARREKQVEVEIPDLDYLDEIQDVNNIDNIPTTTMASIDHQKYPFYQNSEVSHASPLKYIINPKEVPKKTFGGMEFYESRDKYVQCDEVDPNLEEVVPDDEEPVPNRGPKQDLPRLRGLGDKLDCFKAKYFGRNPFDNPLFFEQGVIQPTPPSELDTMKFAARILKLPQENKNYYTAAQSRKPEISSTKRIDTVHRRTKSRNLAESSDVQKSRPRKNTNRGKIRASTTETPQTESRRPRKRRPSRIKIQSTTTQAPEIDSVTPYQKEVYDDVMGTIKNLASLYELFGAQGTVPVTEATPRPDRILSSPSIRNVKQLNRLPASGGKREKEFHSLGVLESPAQEEIEGLLPPPQHHKKPKLMPYRTNKVSYNTRVRTEAPLRNGDKKIIGYFRTVMVHKRSLDGYTDTPGNPENDTMKHTLKKRSTMDSEFGESQVRLRSVDSSASVSTTARPWRGRRRKTSSATTTTTTATPVTRNTMIRTNTNRSVYTVRTRTRHSKEDKTAPSRHGMFTSNERTSATTDARRNEPRYMDINKRRGVTTTTTTTTPIPENLTEAKSNETTTNSEVNDSLTGQAKGAEEIYESEPSVPRTTKVSPEDIEPSGEIYKAIASDFEPEHIEEDEENPENYEGEREDLEQEEDEEEESTDKPKKKIKNYDVHEDVQEDTTPSTVGYSKPTKASEHVDLETYLLTDPPGYSQAFADESDPATNADGVGHEKENYRNEESKDEEVEEDEEEGRATPQNDSYQEEQASEEEGTELPKNSESYNESLTDEPESTGNQEKNAEQEDGEDKTFFRYNTRPDSPFESFEDEKYSELGPRINKPAFHHPRFEAPEHERRYVDESEEEEKDKTEESSEKGKYVFPWTHDEEDEKAEAREQYVVDQTTEKYEYPWDKRERLAEQRERRRRDRERSKKLRDFSFLHDDDDGDYEGDDDKKASSSEHSSHRAYPWDIYDVPSRASNKKNSWRSGRYDSDEMSSEHQPVAKFSSKYSSSKFKLPFPDSEPISVAKPKEIRESVLKYLNEEDRKYAEPTIAYETDVATTSKPKEHTDVPASAEVSKVSKNEPKSTESKNNKRITNSRIIPEDITAAPRKRSRSRVTPVRDRSTLRPVVRPTVASATLPETKTTVTPVTTTKRPTRSRGRSRQQSAYKAQESQITSSAVLPEPKSTTTSSPETTVQTSTQTPGKSGARRRGNSRSNVGTSKSDGNKNKSSSSQEGVTERTTPATTTTRRRTRPTVATREEVAKKTVHKNREKARKPAQVDTRNSMTETTYDEYGIPKTSVISEDPELEDSTPTSRTVEHRSRVSKEEIITKTSFPDEDALYEMYKDKGTTRKTRPLDEKSDDMSVNNKNSKKSYTKAPSRGKASFGPTNSKDDAPVKNESVEKLSITTKETPDHVYRTKEIVDKDGHKGMFVSIIPKNSTVGPSALEDEMHLKKAQDEELDRRRDPEYDNTFDELATTENVKSSTDDVTPLPEDSVQLDYAPLKIPPATNKLKKNDDSSEESNDSEEDSSTEVEDDSNEYEGSAESEESDERDEDKSSKPKFEKDPSRRMYYYLEDKK